MHSCSCDASVVWAQAARGIAIVDLPFPPLLSVGTQSTVGLWLGLAQIIQVLLMGAMQARASSLVALFLALHPISPPPCFPDLSYFYDQLSARVCSHHSIDGGANAMHPDDHTDTYRRGACASVECGRFCGACLIKVEGSSASDVADRVEGVGQLLRVSEVACVQPFVLCTTATDESAFVR